MNRTVSKIVVTVAALFLTAGLVFLCAATSQPSRLLVAVALLLVGGGLAAWGGVALRRLHSLDPENLSDRITQLARAGGGEVTLSQAVAELSVPDEAVVAALNLLERRGQCHREYRGEREVYFFPGLKPTLVKRRCPYCGTEFSVKQALNKCPHCGGDLKLERD